MNNKKIISKKVILIVLVVIIGNFIFGQNTHAVSNNMARCQITDDEQEELLCVATKRAEFNNDVSYCNSLEGDFWKNQCIRSYAFIKKDATKCNLLPDIYQYGSNLRTSCVEGIGQQSTQKNYSIFLLILSIIYLICVIALVFEKIHLPIFLTDKKLFIFLVLPFITSAIFWILGYINFFHSLKPVDASVGFSGMFLSLVIIPVLFVNAFQNWKNNSRWKMYLFLSLFVEIISAVMTFTLGEFLLYNVLYVFFFDIIVYYILLIAVLVAARKSDPRSLFVRIVWFLIILFTFLSLASLFILRGSIQSM